MQVKDRECWLFRPAATGAQWAFGAHYWEAVYVSLLTNDWRWGNTLPDGREVFTLDGTLAGVVSLCRP